MNKRQITMVAAYSALHLLIAGICVVCTDPFGILIVFLGAPFGAAGAAGAIAGKYGFWRGNRRGQLPLVLLGALLLLLEAAVRAVYGYTMLSLLFNLGVVFVVAVQYGCCFLTLLILRERVEKRSGAPAE